MKRSAVPLLALAFVSVGVGAASVVACRGAETPAAPSSSSAAAVEPDARSSPPASSSSAPVANGDPSPPPAADPPPVDRTPLAGSTKRPTIEQCFELQRKLLAKITAKRAVILRNNSGCKTDGDCVLGAPGGCFSTCGGEAVNTKGEGDLRLTSNAAADACQPWKDAGCPSVVPIATCPAFTAACVGGHCTAKIH